MVEFPVDNDRDQCLGSLKDEETLPRKTQLSEVSYTCISNLSNITDP
jgi:hypothetical protein